MQIVTVDSLLEAGIPCSSSSTFLSESSSSQSVISPGESLPVVVGEVIQRVLGKRTRQQQRVQRQGGAYCQTIRLLPQCWVIVGRLQLCNRNMHYWNGLFVPADCVALTDSTATICCCICHGPDPSFLGKIVRVNSWSFIPQKGIPLTRVQSSGAVNSDSRLGILEIHSLELVEGQPSEETLPPLFVSAATAGGRKHPQEISLERQEKEGRGLALHGIPRCISPPFVLPCKSSGDNGKVHRPSGSIEPMLGFFIEIQVWSACSPSCFHIWESSVKRELSKPWKLDGIGRSTYLPKQSPGVCSKNQQSNITTQQSPFDDNFASSSKLSEAAGTHSSKTPWEVRGVLSHIYFSGPAAAWRPVLSGALGLCVTVTDLRKKLILVGNDKKAHIIFLATRKSLVTLHRELLGGRLKTSPVHIPEAKSPDGTFALKEPKGGSNRSNTKRGKFSMDVSESKVKKSKLDFEFGSTLDGFLAVDQDKDSSPRCGDGVHMCKEEGNVRGVDKDNGVISFFGIVTDSLFQGTLLELDKRVWLLLTHQRHTKLHGLRIGSMLSLTDVHAIAIKDLMGKSLLLGACMHSHASVILFSPFLTQTSLQIQSKSLLLKHIQRLSFESTFWLLSLIGSFRQKFRGIYNDKELLGAKKDPGIIQKYAQRMIAPDKTLERDAVKEFFHKQYCKLGDRRHPTPIMQVPPIANFCQHIQALRQHYGSLDSFSKSGNPGGGHRSVTGKCNPIWQLSTSGQSRQLTITGQELGIILLGTLQVCHTSGKLYLLDATGSVDVVIPDLLSSEHLSRIYQVSRFTVQLELLDQASSPANGEIGATLISWSSLLKEVKAMPTSEHVKKFSVHFFMRDAVYLHDLDWRENVARPPGPLFRSKGKGWRQKQMQDRWAKTKSHLDFLRLWFQSQTTEIAGVSCSDHGLGILSEHMDELIPSGHLFKVNCKVVAVKLLVFEWPCGPASSEARNIALPSWLGASCPATSRKSPFGMPLTLACFVVDDGSGPVDCWAIGDAAVSLLGLPNVTGQLNLADAMLERICTNTALDIQPFMGLSLEQLLCHMTRRYGQIVLQNSEPYGDSTRSPFIMNRNGGKPLNDDERSLMRLVITTACLNGSLAIVGRSIPSMEKICSADSKNGSHFCEGLACCSPGSRNDPSLGHAKAKLLAHRVDPVNYTSDLKTLTEQVAGLLYD